MRKIIFLISVMASTILQAQPDSSKTALLLIDIQNFYFAGGASELVNPVPASLNAQKLLLRFRRNNQLVIHIKHGTGTGSDIHPNVAPMDSEKVIVKNDVNCFLNTDLLDYLNQNGIRKLVICGMQTHMCVEAATRAAADYGFDCIVIHDACATKNLIFEGKTVKAEDVQLSTLATLKAYSRLMNTREFLESE